MDFEDEPILEFKKQKSGNWNVYSAWQEFKYKREIPDSALIKAVDHFLNSTRSRIKRYI